MNAPANISKLDRLRQRDGDNCWLCGEPIQFDAKANSGRSSSFEHLLAKTHGGPEKMENLVLCHVVCNRRLKALPVVDKVAMREKRVRKDWQLVMRARILKSLGL